MTMRKFPGVPFCDAEIFDTLRLSWYDMKISRGVAAVWRDSQHTGFGTVHSKPGLP